MVTILALTTERKIMTEYEMQLEGNEQQAIQNFFVAPTSKYSLLRFDEKEQDINE